jgi:6-phosphofructokinase 1
MNAAIRAATRMAISKGAEVVGIRHGYRGMMEADFKPLDARAVGGILQHGGTFLGSARSPEFREEEGRRRAVENLDKAGIDGVIVIGGNGSQTGAHALHELGVPVMGVASTIDNDLPGTERTLGVDTALNIVLESIDRLRTTASSHGRAFLIETMGRDCGYLALHAGVAGGAEAIVIPERELTPEQVAERIRDARRRRKAHAIVIVAEGASSNASVLAEYFRNQEEALGFIVRTTILGHVQRGGIPTVSDRLLGTRFGAAAATALAEGRSGHLVGIERGETVFTPLGEIAGRTRPLDIEPLELAEILAR